jgi:protein-tyrosine phosphatase/arsenate reductase
MKMFSIFRLLLIIPFFHTPFSLLMANTFVENTSVPNTASNTAPTLLPQLRSYIESVHKEADQIPDDRKQQLKKIALFVQTKLAAKEPAQLMFICTHNSRRSHTSQIWAQTLAEYYSLQNVKTFSAGTQVTAFNDRAVKALQRAGFTITKSAEGKNPVYAVQYASDAEPIKAFSKLMNDAANPQSNFCAVMNCSQADKTCPMVPGAALRVSTPYDDPKDFDGTPQETAKYDERCRQIAREMAYLFSQVHIQK